MSKIICDVCGTRYPESAEQCPICGCVRATGVKTAVDEVVMEEAQIPARPSVRGGRFSKANVRKRNKNMDRYAVDGGRAKAKPQPEDQDETERGGSGTLLNVMLVIVIVALLVVTGYVFTQYFLPDILEKATPTAAPETTIVTEAPTSEPTEEPTIPCEELELVNGSTEIVLTERAQSWLLNVATRPEDTTDELVYATSDEAVVTVDEQGCVTAVGEGEAVVTVSCGAKTLEFNIACIFVKETEPEEVTEAPMEEPTEPLKNVTLEVNKTDMTFKQIGQQVTMKVKNGLTNQEVTWTSENESIVTVDEDGVVTCTGWGTTNLIAKYGTQEVTIICRCIK